VADYGLIQIRWKRDRPAGQPAEDVMVNVMHCQVSDGGWSTDDRDVVDDALSAWFGAIAALFSTQVGPTETRLYNMPATAGPVGDPAFVIEEPGFVGTGSMDATLPPQAAISHTLVTAIRRRWGRIYLGGLVSTALTNGRVNATALSTLGDAFGTFGTTLRSNGQGLVVWHRATWTPEDVTGYRIDDIWDVIRRRRYDSALNREVGVFTA